MKTIFIISILCIPIAIFGQSDNLKKEIEKIVLYDTEISYKETPLSVIGIIDGDSTFFTSLYKDEKYSSADENTVFEVGSVTKVFTSSLLKILEAENIIDYQNTVNSYLEPAYRNPRLEHLTIWDLVNHNAGFPRIPEFFGLKQKDMLDPYKYYSKEDLLKYYRDYVSNKKKKTFKYSHTGYALLEIIIENITGISFSYNLASNLLTPLEMTSSFIHFPENRQLIQGYNRAFRKVKPWHFESFSSSEGLKSNAKDLTKFLRSFMDFPDNPLSQVLEKSIEVESNTNYNDKIMIGNGWNIVDNGKKYKIITHTGKTSGHAAFMAFVAETRTGVIILSNSVYGTKDLGFLILRMINDNWKRKHER